MPPKKHKHGHRFGHGFEHGYRIRHLWENEDTDTSKTHK